MPGHISGKYTDRDLVDSSYLQTYIERDVKEIADIDDTMIFSDFIRLLLLVEQVKCSMCQILPEMLGFLTIRQSVG